MLLSLLLLLACTKQEIGIANKTTKMQTHLVDDAAAAAAAAVASVGNMLFGDVSFFRDTKNLAWFTGAGCACACAHGWMDGWMVPIWSELHKRMSHVVTKTYYTYLASIRVFFYLHQVWRQFKGPSELLSSLFLLFVLILLQQKLLWKGMTNEKVWKRRGRFYP